MSRRVASLVIIAALLSLSACITGTGSSVPSLTSPDAIAALGGGLVGQADGVKLSSSGRSRALAAEFQALQYAPVGQPVPWSADGYEGSVVPTQLYRVGSKDCRGYSQTVVWSSSSAKQIGTACRNDVGLWELVQ